MEDPAPACSRPAARSTGARRWVQQQEALRRYWCARCERPVLVCRWCDRGQQYCAGDCARQARRESWRRSSAKYQRSGRGKRRHAARQSLYRRRKKQKVTQQAPVLTGALAQPVLAVKESTDQEERDERVPSQQAATAPSQQEPDHAQGSLGADHLCSFCQKRHSRWTRREPLVQLRRRNRRC